MQERRQQEIAQEEKKQDWLDKYEFHRCLFVEDSMINGLSEDNNHFCSDSQYRSSGGCVFLDKNGVFNVVLSGSATNL